jgi:hypothetical protein
MTIGIGVLGTDNVSIKPDTVVMVSDTQGTFGNADSTENLFKMFVMPEVPMYVVAADKMNHASELVSMIKAEIMLLGVREHGPVYYAISRAVSNYHRERCVLEVLPKWGLSREEWLTAPLEGDFRADVAEDFLLCELGCDLIISTLAHNGIALMYVAWSMGKNENDGSPATLLFVENCQQPGFKTIGDPSDIADFWLNRRGHALGMKPKRAAYHAYEAKRMVENSIYVGKKTEMVIANKSTHAYLTEKSPVSGTWSFAELAAQFERYAPQSTEPLDSVS